MIKITNLISSLQAKIACFKDGANYFVEWQNILYFESVDKRSYLYTDEEVYEVSMRLYEIEEISREMKFFRSSKSQIVNLTQIKSLCPEFGGRVEITMCNDEKVIVSRQYSIELKKILGLK